MRITLSGVISSKKWSIAPFLSRHRDLFVAMPSLHPRRTYRLHMFISFVLLSVLEERREMGRLPSFLRAAAEFHCGKKSKINDLGGCSEMSLH